MISILVADDHQMFREGILSILNSVQGFKVNINAANGQEALKIVESGNIDVVLMDINMPEMDGIEASKVILKEYDQVKVLMLTMHNDPEIIQSIIKMGVHGYLLKHASRAELVEAIESVHNGHTYYKGEVLNAIVSGFRTDNVSSEISLTPRECDILKLICKEHTTQEIADKLHITPNTVESHRKNLLSKTGAKNSIGLVKFAIENGIAE